MHAELAASTTDPVSQLIVGVLIVALFVVLAVEAAHRVLVVMGAVAVLWAVTYLTPFKLMPLESTAAALDLNVLLLLAAMMALVGVLKETGVFAWAVERLLERFGHDPARAIAVLWWFTAIASAFVDNVTTVIFVTPIVLATVRRLGAPPLLVLLPTIMAANIGGTATLIGDPPNIMIGSGAGLTFMDFLEELTIPVLVMMCGMHWWGVRRLRAAMGATADAPARADEPGPGPAITDTGLLRWLGWICLFVLVGFVTHGATGMPAAVPAVIGATAALIVQDVRYLRANRPTHEERQHGILHVLEKEIEWPTLTFFAFLFILVGAAVQTGLITTLAGALERAILAGRDSMGLGEAGTLFFAALLVLWVAGVLSAFMDNIPFVAVSIPIIAALVAALPGDGRVLWWALSLGACLGGNGTPIGASANVTTLGLAEREGIRIGFTEFMATGMRVMIATLLVSTLFLGGYVMLGKHGVAMAGGAVLAVVATLLWLAGRRSGRRAAAVALLAVAGGLVVPARGHAQAGDPALAQRDSLWNALRLRGDAAALDSLLADDWLLTHSDGRTQDKRDYLGELARGVRGGRVNTAITNDSLRVRRYGETAVITSVSVQSGIGADGAPFRGRFRFTRVWVRRDGRWVLVSSHSSRVAAP